jgi:carbon-monoxide dehydrogenase medium subunit
MHAAPFDYHRAESVDDAIQLLEETDDGRLLAGGQALIPLLKKREIAPGTLVDIGGIDELRGITETDTGIQVGALTTHREITESPLIASVAPVLPATVSKITGGIQVHNVATIGGNIARAHPAYDYAGALLAAEARVHIAGSDGTRMVPAAEFFRGACSTCLGPSQLVTGVTFDDHDGTRTGGYAKRKEPASGGAVLGIATDLLFDSQAPSQVTAARVGANGLCESAVRLPAVEAVLSGRPLTDEVVELAADAAGDSVDDREILDNKKATAQYRRNLLGPYLRRSLKQAASD